jgi:hypothetical protein
MSLNRSHNRYISIRWWQGGSRVETLCPLSLISLLARHLHTGLSKQTDQNIATRTARCAVACNGHHNTCAPQGRLSTLNSTIHFGTGGDRVEPCIFFCNLPLWLFLRSRQSLSYLRISQNFTEPDGSLSCSQEPSTSSYPEPDQSSPYHPILFL